MLDFGALPPEINSARMYAGPGSGPMMAAAAAWNAMAGELESFAVGYSSVISGLQGENWSGGASDAMAAAAGPYVTWATTTAAQAEQAASQAQAAAAAYEAAFAATVHPAAVAANRIQLATLVATNFFGQNTTMIAATEAAYAEMWAQDSAAMYGYAASSSAATVLTPLSQPPRNTNAAGQSGQAAAVAQAAGSSTAGHAQTTLSALMSTVPQQLQTLSAAGISGSSTSSGSTLATSLAAAPPSLLTLFGDLNTLEGPGIPTYNTLYSIFQALNYGYAAKADFESHNPAPQPKAPQLVSAGPDTVGLGHGQAFASLDNAARVGKLSVPQSWASATPVASPAGEPSRASGTGFRALPAWAANPSTGMSGGAPAAGLGPMTGTSARPTGRTGLQLRILRMRNHRFNMPRPAVGG